MKIQKNIKLFISMTKNCLKIKKTKKKKKENCSILSNINNIQKEKKNCKYNQMIYKDNMEKKLNIHKNL